MTANPGRRGVPRPTLSVRSLRTSVFGSTFLSVSVTGASSRPSYPRTFTRVPPSPRPPGLDTRTDYGACPRSRGFSSKSYHLKGRGKRGWNSLYFYSMSHTVFLFMPYKSKYTPVIFHNSCIFISRLNTNDLRPFLFPPPPLNSLPKPSPTN